MPAEPERAGPRAGSGCGGSAGVVSAQKASPSVVQTPCTSTPAGYPPPRKIGAGRGRAVDNRRLGSEA
ncbi:unnamed protein product [[Actinomadura] parvosata subsp. kistnae]|nr:unnamed protein product [Actinomadura parvosata subsp. kistnae]